MTNCGSKHEQIRCLKTQKHAVAFLLKSTYLKRVYYYAQSFFDFLINAVWRLNSRLSHWFPVNWCQDRTLYFSFKMAHLELLANLKEKKMFLSSIIFSLAKMRNTSPYVFLQIAVNACFFGYVLSFFYSEKLHEVLK